MKRIADKVLDMAIDSLFSGKGFNILGLFGGVSYNIDPLTGLGYHEGGLVGGTPTFTRYVHPAYFDNAPRYHSGLRPDEVPAILQKGEWVLSRHDVAEIRSGSKGGATVVKPEIKVEIVNHSGAEVRTQQREDGSLQVVINAIEACMAHKASQNRGPLSKAIRGTTTAGNGKG
jgi:hypothetical protein